LNGLFVVLAALTGILLARQLEQSGLDAVDSGLRAASPWFLGLRIILMTAAVGFWPQLVAFLARLKAWEEPRIAFMSGLRWRLATWLAVVEIVLVQNGYAAAARLLVE
jgi:hypothetical protein